MENLIQNIFAISLGMMIFFSFILAPIIFKILDAENAGKFVRKIFPYYYFVNIIFLSIAVILLIIISSLGLSFYITLALVISFVFAPSLGILAITSPALTISPSSTDKIASTDIACLSGFPFSRFTGSPLF